MAENSDIEQPKEDSDSSDVEGAAVPGSPIPIVGDVIGDTAYSERYVLKVLMKFANLEVFKKVIKQKAFDGELVTLWEMSAEKDVVHFLLDHDALDLFGFALPALEGDDLRIGEIVIGIIANMCCEKEAVSALMKNKHLFIISMGYLKTDYTAAIIQALRMISHCLYMTDEEERSLFMSMFEDFHYTEALCFILKNSSNKDLLITALENFNTLCEYLNIDSLRKDFFKQFVTPEVLESVSTAFDEIMIKQRSLKKESYSERDSLERILAITLQIGLNLVWFDNTPQIYTENRWSVVTMISQILSYYEHKIVNNKVFDTDLEHIFQSASMILTTLNVSEISNPNKFFFPGYRIWKTLSPKNNKFGEPLQDEDDINNADRSIYQLSEFLCIYMAQCTEGDFSNVINVIKDDYKPIVKATKKLELQEFIKSRVTAYKENQRKERSLLF